MEWWYGGVVPVPETHVQAELPVSEKRSGLAPLQLSLSESPAIIFRLGADRLAQSPIPRAASIRNSLKGLSAKGAGRIVRRNRNLRGILWHKRS
jgi:hypothetical protein